ncbi:PmeII family type II restriction endonuclease [Brevibacillus brevis]|uniref:PmeII family type II restriction endonuclease n=1 Tax=Brevibacillus brevis TaxID=1393 RepID=UPI0015C59A65|nr:PmeII family type II restriction endonuclease [Brevibacillus brevis]
MNEKEILDIIFKDAGVKRSSLLAEYVCTIDRYKDLTEEDLNAIRWVDKKGNQEPMISRTQAENVIVRRELLLQNVPVAQHSLTISSKANDLKNVPLIKNLFSYFTTSRNATRDAANIGLVETFNNATNTLGAIKHMSAQEQTELASFIQQTNRWDFHTLSSILNCVETLSNTLMLLIRLNRINVNFQPNDMKSVFLKNWFSIVSNQETLENVLCRNFPQLNNQQCKELINTIAQLLTLDVIHLNIALLFLQEVLKMENDVPAMANAAIETGNPFLFRSLFLSFDDAKEFAVGGKLNSSLETKYGNLFEKLMSAFSHCRGVYDGGIDVSVGTEAFDIKSGPNVMNKSQVDAFSAKQKLIQDEGLLLGLTTYKIALGYGQRTQLNSFMAAIDSEILVGRDAWHKITGIIHSPEVVFAIAALVARIFKSKSIVNSMLVQGAGIGYRALVTDDQNFLRFFNSAFDPITLSPIAQQEIDRIDALLP